MTEIMTGKDNKEMEKNMPNPTIQKTSIGPGEKAGIVCCSNGLAQTERQTVVQLTQVLEHLGLIPVLSKYIYVKDSVFSGTARERAQALTDFYVDPEIKAIFDISGGDIANEILPYLDFDLIAANPKQLWGYSDLTTILNAVYTRTGLSSVLYQVRNLVSSHAAAQQRLLSCTIHSHENSLCDFPWSFVQGTHMEGVVAGGNIRCFLKLAGTEFFPDLRGKLLFLESRSGSVPQMVTFLSQLDMLGVFRQINGIILGTFTQMEREGAYPDITSLVRRYAPGLPVAKTEKVGHGTDSMGIVIGGYRTFSC